MKFNRLETFMVLKTVFLGLNDAGEEIYEWLNQRDDVEVKALLTEKEQLELVKKLEPDLVVSAGFEHKVPKEIIEVPDQGIVNLHPSYLPYNKGAHPYIWSMVEETPAGVTLHYMTEEIDEGPIIDKKEVRVTPEDAGKTLYQRLTSEGVQLFKESWKDIKEGMSPKPQTGKGNKHYSRELEELRRIDLNEEVTAGQFLDRLRALSFPPRKNAYFELYGQKYFVDIEIRRD